MVARSFAVFSIALLATARTISAEPVKEKSPASLLSHMVALPDDLKWVDAPPGLPKGSKIAVLDGDPSKAATFTMRVKLPDGYTVPPHWHSVAEQITVISGGFGIGLGEKMEKSKIRYLPPGSFMRMGKEEKHYVVAKGETIIQLHGSGPFDIHYVNPEDDPTKK